MRQRSSWEPGLTPRPAQWLCPHTGTRADRLSREAWVSALPLVTVTFGAGGWSCTRSPGRPQDFVEPAMWLLVSLQRAPVRRACL